MISERLFRRFYPDNSLSGTIALYNWVRRYVNRNTVMLNLGAGPPTGSRIRSFRGEVAHVAGADIDPVVSANEELDEARVIEDGSIPFESGRFDLVLSDFVLEHVERPEVLLGEVWRVLKPSGSFFFRTPNKYHYVSLIARFSPHPVHQLLANRVRGLSEEAHEPYRTFYRANCRSELEQMAKQAGFRSIELRLWEAEPSYMQFNAAAFLAGVAYERLVNHFSRLAELRANILGRFVR
ncbi:MAG: methyltransferase domain-containing protein [Candidatus Binataceae bacterium]